MSDTTGQRGTPKNRAKPLIFYQKANVLEYSPCKTKHIRAESSRARRCINFMGVLYASPNNPDKEYAGKGKASPTERLLDALTRDNKCNGCMALGGP